MPQVNKPAVTEGSSAGGLNFRNFRKSKNVKKHKCFQTLGEVRTRPAWLPDSAQTVGQYCIYRLNCTVFSYTPSGVYTIQNSSYMLQVQ